MNHLAAVDDGQRQALDILALHQADGLRVDGAGIGRRGAGSATGAAGREAQGDSQPDPSHAGAPAG